jgi:hypothetical protein
MFTKQTEEWVDRDVLAIVELDLQKMRVRIVFARQAIRERLQELKAQGASR